MRDCLARDGHEIGLRHKSFQVLLYLLEHRDRTVTKEELIETIWSDTAITPDALVQCIVDIRKALGDDPRHPQFVKTISRVGYRFVGPVEERWPNRAAVETEEFTSVEIEIEDKIVRHALPLESPLNALPAPTKSWFHRRTMLWGVVIVLIIAGSLVVYVSRWWARSTLPQASVTLPDGPGKKNVVVLFFQNQFGSDELNWLREGLTDMLITDLSRSGQLAVLSRQQLSLLLERIKHEPADAIGLEAALEIGRRTRAEAIVTGSFAQVGRTVRIDVQLHDAATGQLLAAERVTVDEPEQILTQIDVLSLKLASHLGLRPASHEAKTGLADAMTDSLPAYRYYSLAVEKAQAWHHADALMLLEKAVAADPEFAMAHGRIGYIYAVVRNNEGDRAKPYLEKAFQLSHRLTEKDRLYIAAWYAHAQKDADGAAKAYRELIARYPFEVEAHWRLGRLLARLGSDVEEVITVFKQGLAIDPEAKEIWNDLGLTLCRPDHYDEALAALERYVHLAPAEPNAYDSLGMCYNYAGRYDEALAALAQALALDPDFHFANLHVGDVYFNQGRYRAAIGQYQRFVQLAPSDWDRALGYNRLMLVYWKKGDLARADRAARHEVRLNNDRGGLLLIALARGDLAAAEKLKQSFFENSPNVQPLFDNTPGFRHFYLGYHALKSGRATEAIEHLQKVAHHYRVEFMGDCLANAYLELNRLDEAIAEYERLLRINPNWPPAYYHLGLAYERKGQRDRARASFERFLELWKAADPDLPEVIAAKQR